MSLFGIEEKVERVRQALIKALKAKSIAIMTAHAAKTPIRSRSTTLRAAWF